MFLWIQFCPLCSSKSRRTPKTKLFKFHSPTFLLHVNRSGLHRRALSTSLDYSLADSWPNNIPAALCFKDTGDCACLAKHHINYVSIQLSSSESLPICAFERVGCCDYKGNTVTCILLDDTDVSFVRSISNMKRK